MVKLSILLQGTFEIWRQVLLLGQMEWNGGDSRIAFGVYQSKNNGRPDIEKIYTRNAEYYGWRIGASNSTPNDKIRQLGRFITRFLKKLWESF